MPNIVKGMIAGFVATLVLSIVTIGKTLLGLMPELNVIVMLSNMMNGSLAFGWVAHFIIGTFVWGGAFALLYHYLPGKMSFFAGISFGVAAWLLMILIVMPMAAVNFFGLNFGITAALMALMLHALYGATIALTFQFLDGSWVDKSAMRTSAWPGRTLSRNHFS